GDQALIDDDIDRCIYAGTMTDTGSFRFPAASARLPRKVADLMGRGVHHEPIHQAIYDKYMANQRHLIAFTLLNRMEVLYEYNAALSAIPFNDIKKYELKTGDTEGLVNYPLSIRGIRFAALIIDRKEEVRLSFRSKDDFDVNAFAR